MKLGVIKLFFLFVFSLQRGEAYARCDYVYSSLTNGWYNVHLIPATWADARLRCSLEGGILASPVSKEISSDLQHILSYPILHNKRLYTGLHATFSKGEFYTVDGKNLMDLAHNWAENEPDNLNNDESCLVIDGDGDLADVNCGSVHPYICFKTNVSTSNNNACGSDGYTYDPAMQKCYKFHRVPRDFSRAHFACSAEGGHLAIINSEEELHVLQQLFKNNPGNSMVGNFKKDTAFIGFHDWGEHGEWRTIHGQTLEEAGFSKFSGGEPNNANGVEFCGSIKRNDLFNDVPCDHKYAFICEKSVNYLNHCDPEKYHLHSTNKETERPSQVEKSFKK